MTRTVRVAAVAILLAGVLGIAAEPWLDGAPARYVTVRWQADVTADRQEALERRYGLRRRSGENRSYAYDLVNPAPPNIRALLQDPAVEDTHDLDRANAAVSPTAPTGIARTGWAWRWGIEQAIPAVVIAARAMALLGILALLATFRAVRAAPAAVRRRAAGAGRSAVSVARRGGRRGAVAALVLIGAGLLAVVPLLNGAPTRTIVIRWQQDIDQDDREALEDRYALLSHDNQGATYEYDLFDESRENLAGLLAEPLIESTQGVDVANLTVSPIASPGHRRTGVAWQWGLEAGLPWLRRGAVMLLAAALFVAVGFSRFSRWGAWAAGMVGASFARRTEVSASLQRRQIEVAVGGVFVFALLLQWLTLGSIGGDDHFPLWTASAFLQGDRPFTEFVDPGAPLYWAVSALAQWVVGYRTIGEVGVGLLLIAFALALSFRLAWQASGSLRLALGIAVVMAFLTTLAKLYSYPKILVYPLGVWLAWRYIDRPSVARSLALAAGVAIAFGYRHDHGAYLAVGASAAVLAAHWRNGLAAAAFGLCRVGALTVLVLSPYLLLIQANEGLVPYFAERMRFAAQTDAAGRRAVPFAVDAGAPLLVGIQTPAPVVVGIRWADGIAPGRVAELTEGYGLTPVPSPPAGGWHRYVIADYSEANLTQLLADEHLVTAEGIVGSFRRGYALNEATQGSQGLATITVYWGASASPREIDELERTHQLRRRAVEQARADEGVTYEVGDPSIDNLTALREKEVVQDIQGVHFVRVPVNLRLRSRVPIGPDVAVRWVDSVTSSARAAAEQRYRLEYGRLHEDAPGGLHWRYELADWSDANVTALATDPLVLFVDGIERSERGSYAIRPWSAPRGGRLSVVWKSDLTDADRLQLEQRYQLEPDHGLADGMTAYNLADASRARIRALLADPAIVDVSGIDKESLRPQGTSWWSALRREYSLLRVVVMPRILLPQNAGVWLYWIVLLLPFAVLATLLVDARMGRAIGIMPGEAQKMFAVAVLMAVANYALMRRLETFADHFDAAAIMGAWLIARAWGATRPGFARRAVGLAATAIVVISVVAAVSYVDLQAFTRQANLALPVREQLALNVEKFRSLSMSPPIDYYAPPDADADRGMLRYLYECTRPEDRIFVTSDIYTVPYYTQRRALGHIYWAAGLMANPEFERRMIALMERDPVPFVFGVGGERPLDNLSRYPLVQAYVAQRYTESHAVLQDQLAGKVLWVLTDSRRARTGTYERFGLPCFS